MVAHANNLSTTTVPANGQPLLVPLQCGCPSWSPSSYAPMQYQIGPGTSTGSSPPPSCTTSHSTKPWSA
ncbi:hypothetical protein Zm00014a_015570 [Zea mays]|uniref:Uncharacterized protein n=1 Tax=Zea mays TaxID=4577 RepID=A0A3L6EZB4_MAIZE|nr:hypothetical protein Zm00014a_015570 [Zea mays]